MTSAFIAVTDYRGQWRLVNATHIQQLIAHDDGTTTLRFTRQAMLDQSLIHVETYDDQLTTFEPLDSLAHQLVIAGVLDPTIRRALVDGAPAPYAPTVVDGPVS